MKWYAKYVGIPFESKGRTKEGADCYGLVRIVLEENFNMKLPLLNGYSDALNGKETSAYISENTPLLSGEELSDPQVGCVVVLSTSQGLSGHVGVIVDKNMILHTTKENGAVIERIDSNRIKNKIRGYYNVNKSYSTN